MSEFESAVWKVTGVLAVKQMVTHLLTVRNRLMTANLTFVGQKKGLAEDDAMKSGFGAAFMAPLKLLLFTWAGPTLDYDRLQGIVRNSIENEPYFLVAAAAVARQGGDLETLTKFVYLYGGARVMHALAYLFALPFPSRAISFVSGTIATLCMGVKLVL
eukprot:TRINITY_DN10044_c0_g1_i1.p1 TRINITY_DN10044_c0_g1~~TRINITY_DN10044_c0_g1_i1.p1  ORF type:complete len:181 (+),score=73.66 TRINITY_DN10044_c0_g1_i1:68-544(+)